MVLRPGLDLRPGDGLGDGVVVVVDFERAEVVGAEVDRPLRVELAADAALQPGDEVGRRPRIVPSSVTEYATVQSGCVVSIDPDGAARVAGGDEIRRRAGGAAPHAILSSPASRADARRTGQELAPAPGRRRGRAGRPVAVASSGLTPQPLWIRYSPIGFPGGVSAHRVPGMVSRAAPGGNRNGEIFPDPAPAGGGATAHIAAAARGGRAAAFPGIIPPAADRDF